MYETSPPRYIRLLKRENLFGCELCQELIGSSRDSWMEWIAKPCPSLGGCRMCPCRNSCALKHWFIIVSYSWLCCWQYRNNWLGQRARQVFFTWRSLAFPFEGANTGMCLINVKYFQPDRWDVERRSMLFQLHFHLLDKTKVVSIWNSNCC